MIRKALVVLVTAGLLWGCARIRVEAPKEPIRVDVSMRLDIYQHIEKDIASIEDMVSGSAAKASTKDTHSFLNLIVTEAHADDLSPQMQAAINARRDRRAELVAYEAKGEIGEGSNGLVVLKGSDSSAQSLVDAENADRMVIYKSVAEKNGSTIEEVQSLYAKRLQSDAPAGTPIQAASGWTTK